MIRKIAFILFLASLSFSIYPGSITIEPFEYKDFGNASLPSFNVTMGMDCVEQELNANVSSDENPVSGVTTFLKYVQYENPLLGTRITDASGNVVHKVYGNISYMSGIWVLVLEKPGYRKQEAHFEIFDCLVNVSEPGQVNPPEEVPECTSDYDCKSSEICNIPLGECEKLGGSCGYAYNHTWIGYECCQDADCGQGRYCDDLSKECKTQAIDQNASMDTSVPNTSNNANMTNQTSGNGEEDQLCPLGFLALLIPLMISMKGN